MNNVGWDAMRCLSNAAVEIKLIKSEVKKIQGQDICKIKVPMAEMSSNPILASVANMSITDAVMVGFEDELETIVDRLTRVPEQLDIVPIVGMPGQGKTTLAKRVYNSPSIRLHFDKCAWCYVSQTYESKKLLIKILTDVATLKDDISKIEQEKLAEQLYKCLKGQRYLIVMDDIWDVRVWDELKKSFPDDNNGSRILFTSRTHNVAAQAKFDCNPHTLRLLSDEESRELFKKKLMDGVIVGFEDELETIVDQLTRGSAQIDIVSIVGMPGLGKTTLAKRVYNTPSVRLYFNKRAWCSVSETYECNKLLINILSDVATLKDDISKMEKEELAEQLYKFLKGQRYLIVMDDIWDVGAWQELKMSFPDDNNGSRIMFTSRIHNVPVEAKFDCNPHPLRLFPYEECWKLLKVKLFGNDYCPRNLEEVGKQIAGNCEGLPLVVVVIAGLLSHDVYSLNWWKRIVESLASLKISEVVTNILELSYMHLPEYLKSCFLYFGAFREGQIIRVQKLTQIWISEGFITKSEMKSLEDVAKDYLMDLVARSLVTVTSRSSNGGVKQCHLHDLLHEFCLAKCEEENILQVDSTNVKFHSSTVAAYKHFRMCFQTKCDGLFASYPSGPCVHCLLCFPDNTSFESDLKRFSFSNFKLLQVLDLEDSKLNGEFPEEIVLLILLRYLAISCSVVLVSIPPSIANLKHLETLCIRRDFGYEPNILPSTIWTMKKLRHLDVGRFSLSFSDDCEPEGSFQLENLHTFSSPSLSYGELAAKLLRRLPGVRKLRCQFRDSWDSYKKCNQFPVLDFLSQLDSLNVVYTWKVLYPCAFSFPSTVKKLKLTDFNLPWTEISTIGTLPNLEVLKLLRDAFYGEKWDMEDEEFKKLKFLKLSE